MKSILLKISVMVTVMLSCQSYSGRITDSELTGILQDHGVTAEAAANVVAVFDFDPQYPGARDLLYERLREGLVKKANIEQLTAALQRRRQALLEAHLILDQAGRDKKHARTADDFIKTLTHALESGLPAEIFSTLLSAEKGDQSLRVQAVIEAGERLHLAGVDLELVQIFMQDCLDRGLRRGETIRAARFWIDRHRQGLSGREIRSLLWGQERLSDCRHNHDEGGSRQERETGRRHGQP